MSTIPLKVERIVQQALIDYAYKHRVSTLYAVHCNLYKSLRSEGFIDEDTYQRLMQQFSSPLVKETIKPLSTTELAARQRVEEKTRYFQAILRSEWQAHESPEWRRKVLILAEMWQTQIPEAKTLLEKFTDKIGIK